MNQILADNIKLHREKLNLSQNKLGQKLSVSQQAVGKWEKAIAEPDCETLIKLSELFDISIDKLLGNNKEHTVLYLTETKDFSNLKDLLNNSYFLEISKLFYKLSLEEQDLTLGFINGILEKK